VVEASSRFGVSLRHREPSTDSCSSIKSGERKQRPPSPPNRVTSPSQGSDLESVSPGNSNKSSDTAEEHKVFRNKESLELKLVAEIKEKADSKYGKPREISPVESSQMATDPALQLVAELGESLRAVKESSPPEKSVKSGLRKVAPVNENNTAASFKAQLKKFDSKKKEEESENPINFKSRLRKVCLLVDEFVAFNFT
jgi:hypothetical protein